ncbi:hypothetical protein F5B22DRAFT_106384 [Xylaria bambusicola]|uniref:uncharacterized protein n=1 Tax=Xylaria bambusicola TaxID=326684 RepID=UPI0020088BFC|nr:uncharacterized protein F5B22DRAFT_106384 [Xylaria bambusicola]KAI0517477.1 hypothetical protein F5B22DRAFT_106384 [Xylaria bambusicola]
MPCFAFFRRSTDANSSQKNKWDVLRIYKHSISTVLDDSSVSSFPDIKDDRPYSQPHPRMLWRSPTGILEPRILSYLNQNKETIKFSKIFDLFCGNGEWLKDLKPVLLEADIDANLVGYDLRSDYSVSPNQIRDFNDLARRLLKESFGTFDVVHVRVRMVDDDPAIVLSGVMKLLKPGGWVQWEKLGSELVLGGGYIGAAKTPCRKTTQPTETREGAQHVKPDIVTELCQYLIDAEVTETEMFSGVAQESGLGKVMYREIITTITGRKPL